MGGEGNNAALLEAQGHVGRFQRQSLAPLPHRPPAARLAGSEREQLLKQAETGAPGDPAERREDMEVAMQQVRDGEGGGGDWRGGGRKGT